VAFVWMFTLDFFIASLLLLYFYHKKVSDSIFEWKIKTKTVKNLLKDSWPLMLSGVAVVIYMKIDQVMIGNMLGEKELGIYSSAVKISEAWYFIPMIISSSVFPSILRVRKKSKELYLRRIQMLYDFFTWFTIGVALIVTFLSPFIINILYGSEYAMASTVLSIHIWAGVFVFLGVASSNYLIAENLTKITFGRTFIGALANIFLNLILIPFFGIVGSAMATLISYILVTFSIVFFKSTRINFFMLIKSFNIFRII
jgi:O-antigen/teichoic acid export membrane protein